jgi:hypothetical protein
MSHFIMLVLASLPLTELRPPPHDRAVFLMLEGCEAAADRTPMLPGLRLVCVPVPAAPAILSAMH